MTPDKEIRFNELLNLFPTPTPADRAYVQNARARGWHTFQLLPAGTPQQKLLDVGSLGGLFAPAFMELWNYGEVHLIGNDLAKSGHITRSAPDGRTFTFPTAAANIETDPWPYANEMFDTVVCTEVLEHLIFDPAFAMNEMCRVLKPGGRALITIPNATSDECLTYLVNNRQPGFLRHYISDALKTGRRDIGTIYNLGHFHEYTGPELEALAVATGFEVLQLDGMNEIGPVLDSLRFRLLRAFVQLLFPRSRRIRESHLIALLKKKQFTPLDQLKNRYPSPLYQPLAH